MPRSQPRTTLHLPEPLHRQLNSYALAATAAGVGLLALAQAAEAKIIYTRVHNSIGPNHKIPLDLNHDGVPDFRFKDTYYRTSQFGFSHIGILSAIPANRANEVEGYASFSRNYASAVKAGARIGPKGKFVTGPRIMERVYSDTGANFPTANQCLGPWANAVNRYLGLKFLIQGKVHFGWARLDATCGNTRVTATLTGYAYESVAGKPIIAGKTHGPDAVVMEPATLGKLASGRN